MSTDGELFAVTHLQDFIVCTPLMVPNAQRKEIGKEHLKAPILELLNVGTIDPTCGPNKV